MLSASTGAPPRPGFQSTPANLSSEDLANLLDSACWEAPSTWTTKWLAFWNVLRPFENMPRLHSTSGGVNDTEAKELQVRPYGFPSAVSAVMMVTPVAKVPSALRKSRGSIAELSLASSLAGSVGCFGASDIHRASKRQVFGRQAERHPAVIGARRIEVEGQMRVDRMGVAELALQRAGQKQAARAAGGEQQ